jgi:branched-chain amino acid transport system substrate-binding protein
MGASRWKLLIPVAIAVLAAAGCGGGGGNGEETGGAAQGGKPSGKTIKIGASLPLTGDFSEPGVAARQGYTIWQEQVNKESGLLGRPVRIIIKDDQSDQNVVVSDYNALITRDKVDLLLGTFSSLLNLPASAVAERNKMLYVEPAGGSPEMFSRGFKYLFFSQQATSDKQGKVFADWVASLPAERRPKTAAYPTLDDPFGAPSVEGVRKILEAAGVETVYQETYAIDTKNFDTIAGAMKAAAPELVVHGAIFEDGVGLVRAMLKADFRPKWLYQTTAPSLGEQYAEAIGPENTEGICFAISHAPQAKTPGNAEFVAKYKEMFGGSPPEDAADAYAAGEVLAAAVEAVGSIDDQAKLADWLRANPVQTILGELRWNSDGSPEGDFLIGQWQNGKVEFILPEDIATSDTLVEGWRPGGAG